MKTLQASAVIRRKSDRRGELRAALPGCASCGGASVRVIVRAEGRLYVQCTSCHHVQNVPSRRVAGPK